MSGPDLARRLLARDPAAEESFLRLYGRLLEKALTGIQYGDVGNVLPLPLFSRRVAAIASRIVLAADGGAVSSVGDPFPETIGTLRLGELYLSSAAAFGSAAAAAVVEERRRALPAALASAPIDLAAFDGRSPLLVFAVVAAARERSPGCPDAASLAAEATGGPLDERSAAVKAHVRACAPCRDLGRQALDAARLAQPPRPVTLPPERAFGTPSRPAARTLAALAFLLGLAAVLALLFHYFGR